MSKRARQIAEDAADAVIARMGVNKSFGAGIDRDTLVKTGVPLAEAVLKLSRQANRTATLLREIDKRLADESALLEKMQAMDLRALDFFEKQANTPRLANFDVIGAAESLTRRHLNGHGTPEP